ncbi:MAG: hypothetical protein GY863_07455 [bacterium]|nr:hypothetical protein [bacterium]
MNICVKKYDKEVPGYEVREKLSSITTFLVSFFTKDVLPGELISFCIELHEKNTGDCEIALIVSDIVKDIGRGEKYVNCIYSHYSERKEELIELNNVKGHEGYLELDDRVKSEIFVEFPLTNDYNIILNGEFGEQIISKDIRNWFNLVSDLIRRNFLN